MVRKKLIGSLVWPYQIESILGSGGMGIVYLAVDQELQRRVALKFLHDHLNADHEKIERFKQEARAVSALNHPNILTIHQVGQLDGRQFIATEFVQGETLRELINRNSLDQTTSLEIAAQVASALTAAHAAEIVHRDIKPDNVMVRADGYVKVLDFGIAKLMEPSESESEAATLVNTEAGTILGTVRYMSPEQTRGLDVDTRTDIWSLGVMLFEMLTGTSPFDGQTKSDMIAAILGEDPFTRIAHGRPLTEKLRWTLAKALTKDRDERYQTMEGFRSDLRNLQRDLRNHDGAELSIASSSLEGGASIGIQGPAKRPSRVINSLAILPFINESPDAGAEYLSDGITESIINNLSQLPKLRVLARSTVFRFKGRDVDAYEAGRQLGVRAVVTGRVRQIGDSLMIGTELIDIAKDAHLWGEHYAREMSDIFSVQEEIAQEICVKLRLKLTKPEQKRLTRRHTEKSNAYEFYLKGRYFWNKRTREGFERAIESFDQALGVDPRYALAYVGLADCYQMLAGYSSSPKEFMPRARVAVERALEIDDSLAEAYATRGRISMFYDWDLAGAERDFKKALNLNANCATAHLWYGSLFRMTGDLNKAIASAKRALDLDPLSLVISANLAMHLYYARRYDEAILRYQKTIDLDQHFYMGHMIGLPFEQEGKYKEAIAAFRKALTLSGEDAGVLACLGHTHAVSGDEAEARKILKRLQTLSERQHVGRYLVGVIHTGLGETDCALECFENSYDQRDADLSTLMIDPRLDGVRSEPRYRSLLTKIGLARWSKT